MKEIIRRSALKLGFKISRYTPDRFKDAFISLKPLKGGPGDVLLSYRVEAFVSKEGDPLLNTHTNYWESHQIAKTFLELGYRVDVIDFRNVTWAPEKDYSFFIAARTNFSRISPLLNKDCIKIVHLDTAHWLFNNQASYSRSLDLQRRKGMTISHESLRIIESNLAIEHADFATLLGNQFTSSTYQYAGKDTCRIPISTCALYSLPEDKDYESCRKHYLWFGSGGLVHKGLDLVLDAFSGMPDYHLYVCGPVEDEKRFVEVYRKELFETPNIHTIGWVDPGSDQFRDLANRCLAIVYPSCAEGQSGSVVNCLHAGLIPIISRESGVDVNNFGVILTDCSVDVIRDSVINVSGQSADRLKQMACDAWLHARTNHMRECFAAEYRKAIEKICQKRRLVKSDKRAAR